MPQETLYNFEFDGFLLNPTDRELLHNGVRLNLKGKDFDVLVCLVKRQKRLVSHSTLYNEVWDGEFVEDGNITTNISKIRKVLGDNSRNPKYIESIPSYGYRFLAEATLIPHPDSSSIHSQETNSATKPPQSNAFQVESHKFVPMFFTPECFVELNDGIEKESEWAKYREIMTEAGRFCLLPFGIGVWHLVETVNFSTLTDLAIWRRRTYRHIKNGQHLISLYADEMFPSDSSHDFLIWKDKFGKPGYVLSLFTLEVPLWETAEEIDTALRILACPTSLQSEDVADIDRDKAIEMENYFLQSGFPDPEIEKFGLFGRNIGYASWAGVSYYEITPHQFGLKSQLVEFEIAVQATWWLCFCIREKCLANGGIRKANIASAIHFLIKQFGKVKSIGATEPIAQRTMHEAVLKTSRLEELVEATIELYNQLES